MVDFVGARAVAYLATTIDVEVGTSARLEFSTTDALAIWINGRFRGYGDTDPYAWYDFGMNPDHPPGGRGRARAGPQRGSRQGSRWRVFVGRLLRTGRNGIAFRLALLTTTRNRVRGVVFDLDGTLYDNEMPIAGAATAMARLRETSLQLRFLTNTTSKGRAALAESGSNPWCRRPSQRDADGERGRPCGATSGSR